MTLPFPGTGWTKNPVPQFFLMLCGLRELTFSIMVVKTKEHCLPCTAKQS